MQLPIFLQNISGGTGNGSKDQAKGNKRAAVKEIDTVLQPPLSS